MSKNEFPVSWIAEIMGISRPTVYAWLGNGKLKSLSAEDVRECMLRDAFSKVINTEAFNELVSPSPSPSSPSVTTSPETSPHTRAPEEKKSEVAVPESKVEVKSSRSVPRTMDDMMKALREN